MKNAKEYKPLVYELVDMLNRQKEVAVGLSKKIVKDDYDETMINGLQKYLEQLYALETELKFLVESVEVTLYKDSADKFEKNL